MFHWLNGNGVVRSIGWKRKCSVHWPGGRVGARCWGPDWARAVSFCLGCPCGLHGDSECHWTMAPWHRARARGQLNKTNQKSTPQGSKGWGWIEKKRKKDKKEKEQGVRCEEWQTELMLSSCWWQRCWFHRWMCSSREKISHSQKMCVSKAGLLKLQM